MSIETKTKSYINTDVIYCVDLYRKDKKSSLKQNITDYTGIFLVLMLLLLLIIIWIGIEWLGIKMTAFLIEKYVVGLTDRIVACILFIAYSGIATTTAIKLGIHLLVWGEKFEQIKDTIHTFFIAPKYLKFYWEEDKLCCFREEKVNHLLTLGLSEEEKRKFIKEENLKIEEVINRIGRTPKFYYHDETQDIRIPDIRHMAAEELVKIKELTTPPRVEINLCTDGEIQIYLRRKEDV